MNLRSLKRPSPRRARLARRWLAWVSLLLSMSGPAAAQQPGQGHWLEEPERGSDTEGRSPLVAVPEDLWSGDFRPGAVLGDTTWYQANYEPDCDVRYWFELAAAQGQLVTASGNGVEFWRPSMSTSEPVGELCQPVLGPWRKTDRDFYVTTLAFSQSVDLVALGLVGGMGLALVDLSQPAQPRVVYQDENPVDVTALDLGVVDGREVVYALGTDRTVSLYDLDAARTLRDVGSVCYEARFERSCSYDVYLGPLREATSGQLLRTIQILETTGDGVVLGSPGAPLSLYRMSSFQIGGSVQLRAEEVVRFGQWGWDVELWQSQHEPIGHFRAAVLDGQQVSLFEIGATEPRGASTISYPPLMTPGPGTKSGSTLNNDRLRHSRDDGRDYLFVGRTVTQGIGPGAEYLYDTTDLATPQLLSGDRRRRDSSARGVAPAEQGYWGWYYPQNETGFRGLAPRSAVVLDEVLYRAARSALDSHRIERTGIFSDGFETADLSRWSGTVPP